MDYLKHLAARPQDLPDLPSTLLELEKIDKVWDEVEREHARVEEQLLARLTEYHRDYYGTQKLHDECENLAEMLAKHLDRIQIQSLAANTGIVANDMMMRRKEREDERREQARTKALVQLKASRKEFQTLTESLAHVCAECFDALMPSISKDMRATLRSEDSILDCVDASLLAGAIQTLKSNSSDSVFARLIQLNVTVQKVIREMRGARNLIDHSAEATRNEFEDENADSLLDDLADEIDQLEIANADTIIYQSIYLCRVLLMRLFESPKGSSDASGRIPMDIVEMFKKTHNTERLMKLICDKLATAEMPSSTAASLITASIKGDTLRKEKYYFDKITTVTNKLKTEIDYHHHLIYTPNLMSVVDKMVVFGCIIQKYRHEVIAVYEDFQRSVLNSTFGSEVRANSVQTVYAILNELLLIYTNANSVHKSLLKRTQMITSIDTDAPLTPEFEAALRKRRSGLLIDLEVSHLTDWLDMGEIETGLLKACAMYIGCAWKSAIEMDECGAGISADQPITAFDHSTLIDDIFYVLKETSQKVLGLKARPSTSEGYYSILKEILQQIPELLASNAVEGCEFYAMTMLGLGASSSQLQLTKVTKGTLLEKYGVTRLTTRTSFPHALSSMKQATSYVTQVEQIINSMDGAGSQRLEGINALFADKYRTVCREFATRLFSQFVQPILKPGCVDWTSDGTSEGPNLDGVLTGALSELMNYMTSIWKQAIVSAVLLEVIYLCVEHLEQMVIARVNPNGSSPMKKTPSTTTFASYFKTQGETPAETDVSITCHGALALDSLVRHLLDWTMDWISVNDFQLRNSFSLLLEVCELITVESASEIYDLCASTKWITIDEELALAALNSRRIDLKLPAQLAKVLDNIKKSKIFKQL